LAPVLRWSDHMSEIETSVYWWRPQAEDSQAPAPVARPAVPRVSRAMPRLRRLLGGRARRLRRARGLTLGTLAGVTGISARFLDRFEQGRTSISIDSLHKVAVALDVPLSLLLQVDLGRRRPRSGVPGAAVEPSYRRGIVRALASAVRHTSDGRFSPRNARIL